MIGVMLSEDGKIISFFNTKLQGKNKYYFYDIKFYFII
jgi:hypothetical protein